MERCCVLLTAANSGVSPSLLVQDVKSDDAADDDQHCEQSGANHGAN